MSRRFRLNSEDGKKIATGALVAIGGVAVCLLVAGGAVYVHILRPELFPVAAVASVLTAVVAILLNAARKLLGQSSE